MGCSSFGPSSNIDGTKVFLFSSAKSSKASRSEEVANPSPIHDRILRLFWPEGRARPLSPCCPCSPSSQNISLHRPQEAPRRCARLQFFSPCLSTLSCFYITTIGRAKELTEIRSKYVARVPVTSLGSTTGRYGPIRANPSETIISVAILHELL